MVKLSVVMPVHNGAPFLGQAIDSILGQTFTDFEFLILDDGSDDETPAILEEYAAKDARLRVVRGGRRGLVATLNDGVERARSDIVARMDADDVSHPERLERQYRHMAGDPDMWVLGTQWDIIDASGKRSPMSKPMPTTAQDVARMMPRHCVVHHPTIVMRRDRILELGGYRAAYQHAEDYDLWLRVIERSGNIENLDWIGLSYRTDGIRKNWQGAVGRISADLARATHALRRAGRDDPTQGLPQPPPIMTRSVLDTLIPESIGFYRLLYQVTGPLPAQEAHRLMRLAWRSPQLPRHRRLFQQMLLQLIKARSHWDAPMVLGMLRALAMHPARFAQLMLAP